MQEIKLKADKPFHNNVDVAIIDFPDGFSGEERQRCKVQVDFSESAVRQLQKKGMNKEEILKHYEEWLYNVVKIHLATDWEPVSGYDEVMAIILEHVDLYF